MQAVLGGWDEYVHLPSGHRIAPVLTGPEMWSVAMRPQGVTEVRSCGVYLCPRSVALSRTK